MQQTIFSTLESDSPQSSTPHGHGKMLALVFLWVRDEPKRTGEVLLIPPLQRKQPYTFGRARADLSKKSFCLTPLRQRPMLNEVRPPFTNPKLSREQLHIWWKNENALEIHCPTRHRMLVNNNVAARALIGPGDVIEVQRRLLLLCCHRIQQIGPGPKPHNFGEADELGMVGESPAMWMLRQKIHFVAQRDEHTLILGPSGTGKELASKGIHQLSARQNKVFISRNAATIPESLVDAELFGNAPGYPNPGMAQRKGMVGAADGGVLFLDEVGELSHALQAHLLRVLDTGEYHRLGESKAMQSNFRLVGASNRALSELKHDFAARMPFVLHMPSLNERIEDIPLLVQVLLRAIAKSDTEIRRLFFEQENARVSTRLLSFLVRHSYSTNVRELKTLLWQCLSESTGATIDCTPEMLSALAETPPKQPLVKPEEIRKQDILTALAAHQDSREKTWRALGLSSRYQLARLMKKHELT